MYLPRDRVIFALDVQNRAEARAWADRFAGHLRWLKVGPVLFSAEGPAILDELVDRGFRVFLDLKWHDIPAVVAGAAREAVRRGVSMLTLHTTGGQEMLAEARDAVENEAVRVGVEAPRVMGVTVLTSLAPADLAAQGTLLPLDEVVALRAGLARAAGLDGIVCSPREVGLVARQAGRRLTIVTPGVRPLERQPSVQGDEAGSAARQDDQVRTATPREALLAGADFLVIGRPLRDARDPVATLEQILSELRQVQAEKKELE